jgi:DNA-directed RNA polymerase beta' subunit
VNKTKTILNPQADEARDLYDLIYRPQDYSQYDRKVTLLINMEKLFKNSLTLMDLIRAIKQTGILCVPSPLQTDGFIDVYIDTSGVSETGSLSLVEARKEYVQAIVLPVLSRTIISGIPGVEAVYPKEVDSSWIFEGNGGKLIDLLSQEDCDTTRTVNDNFWDIYECLGIEAVRMFLVAGFIEIMSFDGTYVNPKHIELVVDRMTLDGTISSINRYGMDRKQFGPLAKAAFEETCENLLKSGIYGETDDLNGVVGAILTGKVPHTGSYGIADLIIDTAKLEDIPEQEPDFVEF